MTFTLVVLVTMVTHIAITGGIVVGEAPAVAIYTQSFGWKSDCERAGEELVKEFTHKDVTVKAKCIQIR